MSNKTKKTALPKLRFPEFQEAEEWQEKSFNELFKIGSGRDYKHLSKGEIPMYGSGGYMHSVSDYLYEGESVCIGRKGTIDKPMLLSGKFWTVDTLFYTHSFQECVPQFIYLIFQAIPWLKHNEAGGIPSLSKTIISQIKTYTPALVEQQKIAASFSSLDDLITAQSVKLAALQTHKRGLMQGLFPTEGETVPKLRFPEFQEAEEWQEQKLGDVAELTSSKRIHLADYVPNGVPFFRGKEISLLKQRIMPDDILYISEAQYKEIKEKYGVPKIGDILITAVGTLANVYRVQDADEFYFKDGNLIWMRDISIDSGFLEILLEVHRSDILASAIGSSQKALTMVELNKLVLKLPSREEQQKIADCLSSLDDRITAQAQKIEALKLHKKGLMQDLFPAAAEPTA